MGRQEADLLLAEANKLDVDVLCWGGTHRFDAFEYGDKFFVNPGSATGAFCTGWREDGGEEIPSFCLMEVSHSPIAQSIAGDGRADNFGAGTRAGINAVRLSVEEGCEWC